MQLDCEQNRFGGIITTLMLLLAFSACAVGATSQQPKQRPSQESLQVPSGDPIDACYAVGAVLQAQERDRGRQSNERIVARLAQTNRLENVNEACTTLGLTPLQLLVMVPSSEAMISLFVALLRDGADVNLRVGSSTPMLELMPEAVGSTALHLAFTRGDATPVVRWLLDKGADVAARDDRGWTPLHWAAFEGKDPEAVIVLLDAGADPTATTDSDQSAYDLIQENEDLKDSDAAYLLSPDRDQNR